MTNTCAHTHVTIRATILFPSYLMYMYVATLPQAKYKHTYNIQTDKSERPADRKMYYMYTSVHVPANKSSSIKGDSIHLSNVITGDRKDIQVATRGVNSEGFRSN